jgi:predicted nucleic acid-binding protein
MLDLILEEKYKDVIDEYGRKKDLYISNIVLGEVLGYQGYTNEQADTIYKKIKKGFKIVKVDTKATLLASEISRYQRKNTGKKLKITDAIIAATTILNNKILMTFDREDFKKIEGLKLFDV